VRATATVVGCLAVAALSIFVVAPAPAYDAWAWLLWGREIADGTLSTAEGPAFKPLPVAVCALLAPFGGAAPVLWVIVARADALLALLLAFRLARRLAAEAQRRAHSGRTTSEMRPAPAAAVGGLAEAPLVAGVLAAVGVALCGAFLGYAAEGLVTGWLLALALAGVEAWRAGRPRAALACAVGCCLLHVEAWPFAAAFGLLAWLRRPRDRMLLAAAAVAVPALWIVPEWIASGDPLRSGARARVPNAGQPALADVPALASLGESARLLLWPLWIGVAALVAVAWRRWTAGGGDRRETLRERLRTVAAAPLDGIAGALALAVAGVAWIVLVAAMAQFGGFSGEPRYATPGVALIAIGGGVGLGIFAGASVTFRTPYGRNVTLTAAGVRVVAGVLAVALALAGIARLDELSSVPAAQAHQWRLAEDLREAVDSAGGRDAVMRCGTPYVGPLRGPLLAYRLDVAKERVEPDLPPRRPGVVFRSAHRAGDRPTPAPTPALAHVATVGEWEIARACRVRKP
jgi:hypothetical protein